MTVRKRHLGPVRDHITSAKDELTKIEERRAKDMTALVEKIQSEIAEIQTKLKKQAKLTDELVKLVEELNRYKGIGIDEVLMRDVADAIEKLEYAYELAADNSYVDVGERIENRLTEVIGKELGGDDGQVKMIDGVAMIPVRLVQDTIKSARA